MTIRGYEGGHAKLGLAIRKALVKRGIANQLTQRQWVEVAEEVTETMKSRAFGGYEFGNVAFTVPEHIDATEYELLKHGERDNGVGVPESDFLGQRDDGWESPNEEQLAYRRGWVAAMRRHAAGETRTPWGNIDTIKKGVDKTWEPGVDSS